MVLFDSVRYGVELEQTEQDLGNVLFCLFVRIAISAQHFGLLCRLTRTADGNVTDYYGPNMDNGKEGHDVYSELYSSACQLVGRGKCRFYSSTEGGEETF